MLRFDLLAACVLFALGGAGVVAASRRDADRRTEWLAIGSAVAAILLLTLRPLPYDHERHLRPFTDIVGAFSPFFHRAGFAALVGNVALFMPLGAVLALSRRTFRHAVVFGFLLTLSIEIVQLGVPGRTTSVDDILLNTLGTALGYLAVDVLR